MLSVVPSLAVVPSVCQCYQWCHRQKWCHQCANVMSGAIVSSAHIRCTSMAGCPSFSYFCLSSTSVGLSEYLYILHLSVSSSFCYIVCTHCIVISTIIYTLSVLKMEIKRFKKQKKEVRKRTRSSIDDKAQRDSKYNGFAS